MTSGSDAEQRDALDQLVARLIGSLSDFVGTVGYHNDLHRDSLAAITELRQRVAAAERGRNEWAAAGCELVMCQSALAQAEARIAEALEYCEDREDIVDGEFGPLPNDFMHIATILKGRQA